MIAALGALSLLGLAMCLFGLAAPRRYGIKWPQMMLLVALFLIASAICFK